MWTSNVVLDARYFDPCPIFYSSGGYICFLAKTSRRCPVGVNIIMLAAKVANNAKGERRQCGMLVFPGEQLPCPVGFRILVTIFSRDKTCILNGNATCSRLYVNDATSAFMRGLVYAKHLFSPVRMAVTPTPVYVSSPPPCNSNPLKPTHLRANDCLVSVCFLSLNL